MNSFGTILKITIFGASHEEYIGIIIDGYPPGIKPDEERIKEALRRRRGPEDISSGRREEDDYTIISGCFKGYTSGAPLTILVSNRAADSAPYERTRGLARPGHADYTYYKKYRGFSDYRGGGAASGRLSVVLVILGALCSQLLNDAGIRVASRVKAVGPIIDDEVAVSEDIIRSFAADPFPVFNKEKKLAMTDAIKAAKADNDSLGSITETFITGLKPGLGDPFFNSMESVLAHLIFSVPGVKGIEFGSGFHFSTMTGSAANDGMYYENDCPRFRSNHNGGISGGISTGAAVIFRTVFRPPSSIGKKQRTINFLKETNETIEIHGRHDPVLAVKGLCVINALSAYAVLEMMLRESTSL